MVEKRNCIFSAAYPLGIKKANDKKNTAMKLTKYLVTLFDFIGSSWIKIVDRYLALFSGLIAFLTCMKSLSTSLSRIEELPFLENI